MSDKPFKVIPGRIPNPIHQMDKCEMDILTSRTEYEDNLLARRRVQVIQMIAERFRSAGFGYEKDGKWVEQ